MPEAADVAETMEQFELDFESLLRAIAVGYSAVNYPPVAIHPEKQS